MDKEHFHCFWLLCCLSTNYTQSVGASIVVTFDLVVERHCGIGDALPTDTIQNSTCHREAHDTENGLYVGKQKHHTCQTLVLHINYFHIFKMF